jgi:hypothetical protein
VWTQQDNGAGDFYFKDGVYEQSHGPTLQMDTYITNILMWVSSGINPPAAPTGLVAAPTMAKIPLTWNSSVAATNYNVKRTNVEGGRYATIATLNGTSFTDSNAVIGTTYYYAVSALDQFGESSNSTQVTALITNNIRLNLAMGSGGLIFRGTNGVSSGKFYLLAASNLLQPVSGWQIVATNYFDSSGNAAFTNPASPVAPPAYYRLSLP